MRRFPWPLVLALSCSGPTVRVETPEPIAIDIQMRVDVFQHEDVTIDPLGDAAPGADVATIESRRRARMEEIQTLKNSRLIGENHDGLLSIRDLPPGDYGVYVRKTVDAENADRDALLRAMAAKEQKPLPEVRRSVADLWRERSFPGEWVEWRGADGAWTWKQKPGSASTGATTGG